MSMLKSLTKALTDFANRASPVLVEKFSGSDFDEAQVKEFLHELLTNELSAPASKRRAKGKSDGPKAVRGNILFAQDPKTKEKVEKMIAESGEILDKNDKPLKPSQLRMKFGSMLWGELSPPEKEKWSQKAKEMNNKAKESTMEEPESAPESGESGGSDEEEEEVKVRRDPKTRRYLIEGTNFVVKSASDHTVVSKVAKDGKVVNLTAADKKRCETKGYKV